MRTILLLTLFFVATSQTYPTSLVQIFWFSYRCKMFVGVDLHLLQVLFLYKIVSAQLSSLSCQLILEFKMLRIFPTMIGTKTIKSCRRIFNRIKESLMYINSWHTSSRSFIFSFSESLEHVTKKNTLVD